MIALGGGAAIVGVLLRLPPAPLLQAPQEASAARLRRSLQAVPYPGGGGALTATDLDAPVSSLEKPGPYKKIS
jgi:hypothetical protein